MISIKVFETVKLQINPGSMVSSELFTQLIYIPISPFVTAACQTVLSKTISLKVKLLLIIVLTCFSASFVKLFVHIFDALSPKTHINIFNSLNGVRQYD